MKIRENGIRLDIIGYSDDGKPIVAPTNCCHLFLGQEDSLCLVQECWYCKYADFRTNPNMRLNYSICHHPKNQMDNSSNNQNNWGRSFK
ncbi:MAG: hypothetical protein RSD43_03755 [Anaerovoracaceae bacterium]